MNNYFNKMAKLLEKKEYECGKSFDGYLIYFAKRYNDNIFWVIEYNDFTKEYASTIRLVNSSVSTQEQIDEIQLAFNNLQADLKELKEIKND